MLQLNPKPAVGSLENPGSDGSQPRRLQIALALLLVALAVTLIRDRQFWFGGGTDDSDILGPEFASQPTQPAAPAPSPAARVHNPKKQTATKTVVTLAASGPADSDSRVVTTKTGLGHGLLYTLNAAWYDPAIEWISKGKRPNQKPE